MDSAPPSSVMNSRRLILIPKPRPGMGARIQ
jgi:hypothetical protein